VLFPNFIPVFIVWLNESVISRLRTCTKPIPDSLLVGATTDVTRSRRELLLENALLRQQLIVLNRQVKRPKLGGRDRAVMVGLASLLAT
jgi:hypothetical protein